MLAHKNVLCFENWPYLINYAIFHKICISENNQLGIQETQLFHDLVSGTNFENSPYFEMLKKIQIVLDIQDFMALY